MVYSHSEFLTTGQLLSSVAYPYDLHRPSIWLILGVCVADKSIAQRIITAIYIFNFLMAIHQVPSH